MKHSENKAAGAHQQAKGLLDELEEVRRKYGLAEEIAPRAGDSRQSGVQSKETGAASKKEGVIMTDQENQKQKTPRGPDTAGDQPVYYDANGNPVTPVVYYDAEGRPVIPVFAAQPVHPPQEEQYETLPDGTRVRIVYQEPESKRTSAAKPPVAPKPQVIPAEKKGAYAGCGAKQFHACHIRITGCKS